MQIGILGANGQVGCEVAIALTHLYKFKVIGFVRAEYSSILLNILGIEVVIVNTTSYQQTLSECDVVVDCTYPNGQTNEIPKLISESIENTLRVMGKNSKFIFMSSIMAFGMEEAKGKMRSYRIPRTVYGIIKRRAEKELLKISKSFNVKPFIFRLGQTHGVLQSVTESYRLCLEEGYSRFLGSPDELLNTIFIHSLAESIIHCSESKLEPRETYSLVSSPQWTQKQIVDFYSEVFPQINPNQAEYVTAPPSSKMNSIKRVVLNQMRVYGETYILPIFPKYIPRIKGIYRTRLGKLAQFPLRKKPPEIVTASILGLCRGNLIHNTNSDFSQTVESFQKIKYRIDSSINNAYSSIL